MCREDDSVFRRRVHEAGHYVVQHPTKIKSKEGTKFPPQEVHPG